ncbi:YeeE/YedE family protein [Brevundimonas sp. R86498]|uniref:YeeE/YedE family protein n=1 Tax=Brevundimonas sp. R86498 TaxID=3093845 RepID=UPI0037C58D58
MSDLLANALPVQGLIGGLMIGTSSAIMLLGLGRIAGVSGLAARATGITVDGAPRPLSIAFVIGLPLGAALVALLAGPVLVRFEQGLIALIVGGLLVGFGTRLGSGCTSGHGVCGMSRLSARSLVATGTFMVAGFATVAAMNAMGLGL